ncbi:DUF6893 family small protein [Sphaerisporangium corydalis]|uniref:DUF6893 family small protein n=1 Tax=Sphaerisporangium corydalis TaxID=1441875 RepID=A0ABV9EA92_9ACTN
MTKRVVALAVLVAAGVLVYQSIPDLRRYMQIRQM